MRLLRKLNNMLWINKEVAEGEDWLPAGTVSADALKNFATTQNTLSVYTIEDDEQILKVVSAIVAAPKSEHVPENTDYVVFDESVLRELGIESAKTPGETLDQEINDFHRDLVQLSGEKILRFAEMLQDRGSLGRIRKRQLANTLRQFIQDGRLAEERLSEPMRASIEKHARN